MSEPEKTLSQDVIDAIERGNKWTTQHSWIPKHGIDDDAAPTTEPKIRDESDEEECFVPTEPTESSEPSRANLQTES